MSLYRPKRRCVALAAIVCALLAGCKTHQDAVAAAAQMATTAQTLCAYYTSLDHVLAATEDTYQAQLALSGIPAMDLSNTRAQVKLRADMASDIGKISTLFQKLTSDPKASDAPAAAEKLATQISSLVGLTSDSGSGQSGGGPLSSSEETKAMTEAIRAIALLIQQHDEVKAAKEIEPLVHNLVTFYESERAVYDSINKTYLSTAQSVAHTMVKSNQVDASAVFVSVVQPFGLSPSIENSQTKTGMQDYLNKQIDTRYSAKLKSAQDATEALDTALKEMDARITLVAHDKPMQLRLPPLSLATVQSWIGDAIK
jgi:hypothetical protein